MKRPKNKEKHNERTKWDSNEIKWSEKGRKT